MEPEDEEKERIYYVVTKVTGDEIRIITPYWRQRECRNGNCEQDAQHTHFLFDPKTDKNDNPVGIILKLCQDETCTRALAPHVHQGNDDKTFDIEVPELFTEKSNI